MHVRALTEAMVVAAEAADGTGKKGRSPLDLVRTLATLACENKR